MRIDPAPDWFIDTNVRANLERYVWRKEFDCGLELINRYYGQGLKRSLRSENVLGLGTYLTSEHPARRDLAGFCTLALCSLETILVKDALDESNLPAQVSAIRLVMLGVDRSCQGMGMGKALLMKTFAQAIRVHLELPIKGVYLDAAPEAVAFYRSLGFAVLKDKDPSGSTAMFIGIKVLMRALSA